MLNKLHFAAIAAAALALASPGADAQTPAKAPAPAASSAGIGEGDTEFNFFGSLSDHEAFGTSVVLGVGIGRFVSNDLQLKLTQSLIFLDGAGLSVIGYSPYVSAEFQIRPQPAGPFVLYVGGGVGLNLLSVDSAGFDSFTYSLYLTPVGGFKYFLSERMSLTYSLSYQFPLVEETCTSFTCFDSDTTTLQNFLGFSIYY